MKKSFIFFIALFLFMLTACDYSIGSVVSDTQEASITQTEVIAPDERNLQREHKNFRWYQEGQGVASTFVIYDKQGEEFYHETDGYKAFKSEFSFVSSDILQARWSGGSYTSVHQFFDIVNNLISPEYCNVIVGYGKAAYLEYDENLKVYQLVVQDIFARGKFRQVYKRTIGFRGGDEGYHGLFLDENRLLLEYAILKDEPHPFYIAYEIIDLTASPTKEPKLLPFVTPEAMPGANILERGTNYLIYEDADEQVGYNTGRSPNFAIFYDRNGKEIHRTNSVGGDDSVSVVGENLLLCGMYGSDNRTVHFINFETSQISPEIKTKWSSDILIRNEKITYINEKNQVVVQDMFDPAKFYQAFDMQEETRIEFWVDDSHIQVMCSKEVDKNNQGQVISYWNEVLEIMG